MTNYTKRAVRGASVVFVSIMLSSFFAYLFRVFLARNLELRDFGLFFAVYSFITFLYMFRDFGLNLALVKYTVEFNVKEKYNKIKTIITYSLIFQIFVTSIIVVVLFIISDYLAVNYFKDPTASIILKLLSFALILSVFDDVLKSVFQGLQRMKYFSLVELVKSMAIFGIAVVLVYFELNIFAPIFAVLFSSVVTTSIFLPFLFKFFKFFSYKLLYSFKIVKKLFFFGVPAIFTTFGSRIIGYTDILVLTYFRSLEEVGVYSVILPTVLLCIHVSRSISTVIMPIGSELYVRREHDKLADGMRRLQKYTFLIMIPIAMGLFSFSKLFIKVFFGNDFVQGAVAMQILLVGVVFFAIARTNNGILAGIGKPHLVAKIVLLAAAINIVANLILIPKFGIEGAAVGTCLGYFFAFILSNIEMKNTLKLKLPVLDILKTFVAGFLFVLAVYYLKKIIFVNVWVELIIALSIASLAYIMAVFGLKLLTVKELKNLLNRVFN